jgi:hypothetical protein
VSAAKAGIGRVARAPKLELELDDIGVKIRPGCGAAARRDAHGRAASDAPSAKFFPR